MLEKSAPPPHPHPFCPLGTASNPEEEAHLGGPLGPPPLGATCCCRRCATWSRGAEDRFPPRASRPPLRPQTSPNHIPRRQGFPGGRAPLTLEPGPPHRFPSLHHCLALAPKIGLRVPGRLPDLYSLATPSIPSFRLLPHCLARENWVFRTKNSSGPSSRSLPVFPRPSELGTPILTSPILRRSSQLRATVLALGVTQSSAHFPSESY